MGIGEFAPLIIIVLTVAVIIFVFNFNLGTSLQECQEATPPKYELQSHYSMYKELNCLYETLPEYEYDSCVKEFTETNNHGIILRLSTCPGGN